MEKREAIQILQEHISTYKYQITDGGWERMVRAAYELGRSAYGFEIDRTFYRRAKAEMLAWEPADQISMFDTVN